LTPPGPPLILPQMASRLYEALHPAGWTDRRTYRLAIGGTFLIEALLSALIIAGALPPTNIVTILVIVIGLPVYAVVLMLTIRRLRDAGWSTSWAALMVLILRPWPPVYIVPLHWGSVSFYLPTFELIPVLIGVLAPSDRPVEDSGA
jgi:uncharacterized membrane protein YhaH (DUF805 family)